MTKALIYIHGLGGNAQEAEQFRPILKDYDVFGLDFDDFTAWGTREPILSAFNNLQKSHETVSILANSIGAYFSMLALKNCPVERAFFVSPVLDLEQIILGMMKSSGITEAKLCEVGEILTASGELISWKYLRYVRDNPVQWNVATEILYGENDNITSLETVKAFATRHNASLTIMKDGEHWFHTPEQLEFLYNWLQTATSS
ncbi:MAG: hypothetical protein IJU48_02300 [Synergistaceae bacterium]|nr:hypothetical protein [Synergistaceae bacterium]